MPVVEIRDLNSSPFEMCMGLNHFGRGFDIGRHPVGCVGTAHDAATAVGRVAGQLFPPGAATCCTGCYGTEQLLAGSRGIECAFYRNDAMVFGGMRFVAACGMRVLEDIGIAGRGDLPIASVLPRRLTTCHVPHLLLGQVAAEVILARRGDEPVPESRAIRFPLIPGSTVRRPGEG